MSKQRNIIILETGAANYLSVVCACQRLGLKPGITQEPGRIEQADALIIPGVGSAGGVMPRISHLRQSLMDFQRPILGICLGLQVMYAHSAEGDVEGLGVLSGQVRKIQAPCVPHMGWNQVEIQKDHPLFKGIENKTYFYFVHSYIVPMSPQTVATSEYGEIFPAVVIHNNWIGLQFHPEKSSVAGARLLQNFFQWAGVLP